MTTLQFSLSPEAISNIHDVLVCLAKFNESVSLEAYRDKVVPLGPTRRCPADDVIKLNLTALNLSRTAYAACSLDAKTYFSSYIFTPSNGTDRFAAKIYNKVGTA